MDEPSGQVLHSGQLSIFHMKVNTDGKSKLEQWKHHVLKNWERISQITKQHQLTPHGLIFLYEHCFVVFTGNTFVLLKT